MPSLLTEERQGEHHAQASILRDLDPQAARLGKLRPGVRRSRLPLLAVLAAGLSAVGLSFGPWGEGEPGMPASPPPDQAGLTGSREAPRPPSVTSRAGQAAPAEPSGLDKPGSGPAIILTPTRESTPAPANPLKALAADATAAPAARAAPSPARHAGQTMAPVTAPAKGPLPASPHSGEPGQSRPGAPRQATAAAVPKAGDGGTGGGAGNPGQPPAAKQAAQRDVDIITAIVKDR